MLETMRYLTPLLFAAATCWMWYYNATHDSSKLVLPLIDVVFPEVMNDPIALADRSFQAAVVITGAVTVLTVLEHLRAIRQQRQLQRMQAEEAAADDASRQS